MGVSRSAGSKRAACAQLRRDGRAGGRYRGQGVAVCREAVIPVGHYPQRSGKKGVIKGVDNKGSSRLVKSV